MPSRFRESFAFDQSTIHELPDGLRSVRHQDLLQLVHYDVVLHRDDHQEVEQSDELLDVVRHHVRTMLHCAMRHRRLRPCYATQHRVMLLHHCEVRPPSLRLVDCRRDYLYCVRQQGDLEVPD
jgi:hypothetical protein